MYLNFVSGVMKHFHNVLTDESYTLCFNCNNNSNNTDPNNDNR